jgi:hypothetical protein
MRLLLAVLITLISFSVFSQFSGFESTDFSKVDSIVGLYQKFNLRDQKKLTLLLTKDLKSDVDKFRAIFKWITNNISYDLDLYREHNRKENQLKHNKKKLEKLSVSWSLAMVDLNLQGLDKGA